MTKSDVVIELNQLSKQYHERVAVDALSLKIYEGECFALLGSNGAGKTTTIKMLSGLTRPTRGDALIFGQSIVTDMDKIKPSINISPQETAIAPNLSVYENLVFMAEIYGFSKPIAKAKATAKMLALGLTDRKHDKSKKLSGGLKRRLSIAMALISDPKIIFLDEPTLGLDIRARRDVWTLVKALKDQVTIILTSHYLDEVEFLADRIAIIDQGRLMGVGSLEALKAHTQLNRPEDIFIRLTNGGAAS